MEGRIALTLPALPRDMQVSTLLLYYSLAPSASQVVTPTHVIKLL
jgi:hypothetical protein